MRNRRLNDAVKDEKVARPEQGVRFEGESSLKLTLRVPLFY
jgi:hypothetical protein